MNTRDEVLAMAEQAGGKTICDVYTRGNEIVYFTVETLCRFYDAVNQDKERREDKAYLLGLRAGHNAGTDQAKAIAQQNSYETAIDRARSAK